MVLFKSKEECCGCGACASVCGKNAITMQADNEGFLYPLINNDLCVDCGLCSKACPVANERINAEKPLRAFGFKHSEDIRKKSSSGGLFTAISDYVFERGGVVYGAVFDENFQIIHSRAENECERDLMRGSKYVQSDMTAVFKSAGKDLEDGKPVLFSGTPCQVAAIRKYIGENKNLITCDIICHGVPSPVVWNGFLEMIKKRECADVKSVQIRDTANVWGEYVTAVEFENGKKLSTKEYIGLFSSNCCMRPVCHQCKYTTYNRESDFTLADFWGIDKKYPEFSDKNGVSFGFLNSEKAEEIFKEIKNMGDTIEVGIGDTAQEQLKAPTKVSSVRKKFWKDYEKHGTEYVIDKYVVKHYGYRTKMMIAGFLKKTGVLKLIGK